MNEKPELKVDWCTYKAAKYACINWHYSGCMPCGKLFKIGVWEDSIYIGCVLYGRGANLHIGMPFGLEQIECCELVRIALNNHITPVTQIVAKSLNMLKVTNKNMRLIISMADPEQNHHGGIYQAGNWIYIGKTKAQSNCIYKGKIMHKRSAMAKFGTTTGLKFSKKLWKHKYLMPLDKKMRRQIIKLSKPYPKKTCPEGVTGSTSGFQPEGIGSSPISGLKPIKTGEVNGDAK